jgi:hypothetical protein
VSNDSRSRHTSNSADAEQRFERAKEAGTGRVKLDELVPPEFISDHSPFDDLRAMLDAAGVSIESAEDFHAKAPQIDAIVREHTAFGSWQELVEAALAARERQAFEG